MYQSYGFSNPINFIDRGPTGTKFERDAIGVIAKKQTDARTGRKRYLIKQCTNTKIDKYKGTDMIFQDNMYPQGIRIDFTTNFLDKTYMPYYKETDIPATDHTNFFIGIRYGNDHHGYTEFKQPVIVLGVNMTPREYDIYDLEILDNLEKYCDDILQEITVLQDTYDLSQQNQISEFDKQTIPKLKDNPYYRTPNNLSVRYQKADELIQSINDTTTIDTQYT